MLAFAFVLPLFEAPKNLFWVLYVGVWIANRWHGRRFGGPWDGWDTLIAVWIASGYVSALFAGIRHSEWMSAHDILRYASMLWLIRRAGYDEDTLRRLLAWLVIGTLAALLWGYIGLLVTGERRTLGLKSVGHVNHSAIYLAIAFGAALAWLRAAWCRAGAPTRAAGLAVCSLFGLSQFVMASGAALGMTIAVALVLLGSHAVRARKPFAKVLVAAVLLVGLGLAALPEVVEKNIVRLQENRLLAARDGIWRAGLEAWRKFPLFGAGMGNYGRIDHDSLERWSSERGESVDRSRLYLSSHGHSLYVNTLVERGIFGIAVVFAVLAAWGWAVARGMPRTADSPLRWAYWGGALAAWMIAVLIGLVNTTLHHEHALLSMLLLGGWLSLDHARKPQDARA